jgi:hypothetical protein
MFRSNIEHENVSLKEIVILDKKNITVFYTAILANGKLS